MAMSLQEFAVMSDPNDIPKPAMDKDTFTFKEFMGSDTAEEPDPYKDYPGPLRSFVSGLSTSAAGLSRTPGFTAALMYQTDPLGIPQTITEKILGWTPEKKVTPDWMVDNPLAQHFDKASEAWNYNHKQYPGEDLLTLWDKGEYAKAGNWLVNSVIENAPSSLTAIASTAAGHPEVGLGLLGVSQAANTYKDAKEKELSEFEALSAASINGAAEALWESAGTFGLLKWGKELFNDVGKQAGKTIFKNTIKYVLGSAVGNANEEYWTQITQDFTNKVYGIEDIAWKDFPGRALQAGIIGMGSTAMSVPGGVSLGLQSQAETKRLGRIKALEESLKNIVPPTGNMVKTEIPAVIPPVIPPIKKNDDQNKQPKKSDEFIQSLPIEDQNIIYEAEKKITAAPASKDQNVMPDGSYTPERVELHNQIKNLPEYNKQEAIAPEGQKPKLLIVIGSPASGKSTLIREQYSDLNKNAITTDSDDIMPHFPGYDPGLAQSYHAEARDITKDIISNAISKKMNLIIPTVGHDVEKVRAVINGAKSKGYDVELVLTDLDPISSAESSLKRYKSGGRYVSPKYGIDMVGLKPQETYDKLILEVTDYARYKTNPAKGERPRLIGSSQRRQLPGYVGGGVLETAGEPAEVNAGDQTQTSPEAQEVPSSLYQSELERKAQLKADQPLEETPTQEVSERDIFDDEVNISFDPETLENQNLKAIINNEEKSPMDARGVSFMITNEARSLRGDAIRELGDVAAFIRDNGGIRPFENDVELEEYKSNVPKYLRNKNGRAPDEMADNLFEAGLIEEGTSAAMYESFSNLPSKFPVLKSFMGEAADIVAEKLKGFRRVQPGLKKEIHQVFKIGNKEVKEISEKMALSRSLQRQAIAASQAAQYTKKQLTDLKRQIVDEAKKYLPASERGWLNSVIATASTSKDVAKATSRIYNRLNEIIHSDLVSELKTTAKRAIDNDRIDVEYRKLIGGIVDQLNFKSTKEETLQKLLALESHINKQKEQGKDSYLPNRYLETLKILRNKSVQELTLKDLSNLLNKIDLLENLGRQRVINQAVEYQREKAKLAQNLIDGVSPIERKKLFEPVPGQKITIGQYISNKIASIQNELKRIDLAITPIDTIMDILDGIKHYQGPHSLAKNLYDIAFGNYLTDNHSFTEPVIKMAEDLKLGDTNFERIAVHAYRMQENGMEYLLNSGLTEEEINAIDLTPDETKLYNAMREQIEKPYDRAVKIVRDLYNRHVGKLTNYFPVQLDQEKISDVEVFDRVGDVLDAGAFGLKTKTVQQGFTKQRTGTKRAIKLNAMDTFRTHMDDVAYLVNTQRTIKMLSEIFNSPRYREKSGDLGSLMMSQWVDTLARKGGGEGLKKIRVLDTLRRNFGAAQLGFKLGSILVQPTALFDGAAQIGGKYTSQGMIDVITDPKWRAFLRDNFPELKDRGADDPAFQDLSLDKKMAKIQSLGYGYLKKADIITASAIAAGAYRKSLEKMGLKPDLNAPNKQAILEAQRILRRTQGSAFFKDISQAQSRGAITGNKSLDKLITQFRSFMLTRWSQIRHDLWRAGIKEGDNGRAMEIAFWLTAAQAAETGIRYGNRFLIASLVGGLGYGLKELDDDFENLPKDFLAGLLGNVPLVGDFAQAIVYKGRRDLIPAMSVISDILSGGQRVVASQTGKKNKGRGKRLVGGLAQFTSGIAAAYGVPGTAQFEQLVNNNLKAQK